jgi:hypothetical protein
LKVEFTSCIIQLALSFVTPGEAEMLIHVANFPSAPGLDSFSSSVHLPILAASARLKILPSY